ncbi:hypothetical protein CEXT_668141 [Caerostris extrusa]|uniref:Uncharacterized protein n=1 Tax=Caerostris extrusa TaxID=172846 RepID=A0AAV4VXW5_CAEEX|nr:hypothetical protein CEXT_668141 [Caerostris extrusa]
MSERWMQGHLEIKNVWVVLIATNVITHTFPPLLMVIFPEHHRFERGKGSNCLSTCSLAMGHFVWEIRYCRGSSSRNRLSGSKFPDVVYARQHPLDSGNEVKKLKV